MSNIYENAAQLIGNTPLLALSAIAKKDALRARILVKLECRNPAGSIKDRVALAMINDAQQKGLLQPGSTIIEPTSGNTGIGLCSIAAARQFRCIIVMPDSMSVERQLLMKAYGAEVVLTPGKLGMNGAIEQAQRLAKEIPGSFLPGQFANPANPQAHYLTTGPEIYRDTDGRVDILVAGIGTGGTISGAGRYLKEQNAAIRVVGVEPAHSPVLTKGYGGAHGIMGIGAGFIPDTLDLFVVDEVIAVSTEDAYAAGRRMGTEEGILVGISSGAALYAAMQLAKRAENEGKTIVAILPDSGERYLSTPMYAE